MSATPSEPLRTVIAHLMKERNVSYRGLAPEAGLSAGHLSHVVHGVRTPSDSAMESIAAALGVDPSSFTEYRLNRVVESLGARPKMVDSLFHEIAGEPR